MTKYQILSLDGGGIRGLLTVRLLERLATTRGLEGAFDNVYLIAGNSSGALIALGMSAARTIGKPAKTVLAEMVDMGLVTRDELVLEMAANHIRHDSLELIEHYRDWGSLKRAA